MKKLKTPTLRFSAFTLGSGLPPATSVRRKHDQNWDDAWRELARFCRWEDTHKRFFSQTGFVDVVEVICSRLRQNLELKDMTPPPLVSQRRVERINRLLTEAMLRLDEDWRATEKIMLCFDAPDASLHRQFWEALAGLAKVQEAAQAAAQTKEPVVVKIAGRKSSSFPKLEFLKNCRDLMHLFSSGRKVSLNKAPDTPLKRFAGALYKYATGFEPESFDRQLSELRDIPPPDVSALPALPNRPPRRTRTRRENG